MPSGGKHDNMRTYSADEALIVMQLVERHSPRWTHIAKLVSEATGHERTAASVRNYYKRFCASKAIAERDTARKLNRCQICGQIKRGHICRQAFVEHGAGNIAVMPSAAPEEIEEVVPAPADIPLALSSVDAPVPPLAAASLAPLMLPPSASPTLSNSGPFSASSTMSMNLAFSPTSLGLPASLSLPSASLGLPSAAFGSPAIFVGAPPPSAIPQSIPGVPTAIAGAPSPSVFPERFTRCELVAMAEDSPREDAAAAKLDAAAGSLPHFGVDDVETLPCVAFDYSARASPTAS